MKGQTKVLAPWVRHFVYASRHFSSWLHLLSHPTRLYE